jgi:hypothetical protein
LGRDKFWDGDLGGVKLDKKSITTKAMMLAFQFT